MNGAYKNKGNFGVECRVQFCINYRIAVSLFCARIERKTLRISLIIIKTNLYPQSTIGAEKEGSYGMGSQIKSEPTLY